MSTISASNQNYAHKYLKDATSKFEAIKQLDNNPLVDKDPRRGEVNVAVDNWTSSASFRPDGSAASFRWKSSDPNPNYNADPRQDDIADFTETISLETEPAKNLTTVSVHFNEDSNHIANRGYRAIFHTSNKQLLVFDQR